MPEVLRLLSRSKKTGCLRVDTGSVDGRIYLSGGAISFANTGSDEDARRAVVNAGLVDSDALHRLEPGSSISSALAEGVEPSAVADFVREMVVESLYRIRKPGHGEFVFAVDLEPPFVTDQQFDTDVAVAESDRRAAEWADVLSVLDDLDAPVRMARSLPDENSVTIAGPTWKVLAALGDGMSVRELADGTGISEFRAARELSGLLRADLVEIGGSTRTRFTDTYQAPVVERAAVAEPARPAPAPSEPAPATAPEPPPAPSWESPGWEREPVRDEHQAPTSSWFADGESRDSSASVDEAPAVEAESPEPQPVNEGGWWANAVDEQAAVDEQPTVEQEPVAEEGHAPGANDPDSFLESVFSQLNEDPEAAAEHDEEDETGFSMGLLRRRRMGTSARDISDS